METIEKHELEKYMRMLLEGLDSGRGYATDPVERRNLFASMVAPFNKRYGLGLKLRASKVHIGPDIDTRCYMREFIDGEDRYRLADFMHEGLTVTMLLLRPNTENPKLPPFMHQFKGPHAYMLAEVMLVDIIKG